MTDTPSSTAASTAVSDAPDPGGPSSSSASLYAWYVLLILMLTNAFNAIDRALVSIVVESIRAEFGFNDTQIGILSGIGFAFLYAVLGFPIARLADRYSRRNILAIGLAFWSLLTVLTGRATNFTTFLIARIGVGVGEASCYPTAYPLIGDYFPKSQRPIAMAIFQMGMFVGVVGGAIISAKVAGAHGWRAAFTVMGIPGVILALVLFLTVREPVRGRYDPVLKKGGSSLGMLQTLKVLLGDRRFLLLVIATTCLTTAAAVQGAWGAAFVMRLHDVSQSDVGVVSSPVGLFGLLGTIAGGLLGSYLARRQKVDRAPLLVPLAVSLIAVPGIVLFILAGSVPLVIVGGMLGAFGIALHTGPVLAVAIGLARPDMRGLASAMLVVGQLLIGFGFGPVLVGVLSDVLAPSQGLDSLRWALAVGPVLVVGGWVALFAAYRAIGPTAQSVEG